MDAIRILLGIVQDKSLTDGRSAGMNSHSDVVALVRSVFEKKLLNFETTDKQSLKIVYVTMDRVAYPINQDVHISEILDEDGKIPPIRTNCNIAFVDLVHYVSDRADCMMGYAPEICTIFVRRLEKK